MSQLFVKAFRVSCALFLLTAEATGGPLTPPAGPVTGTGKTLTEVEPRVAINDVNTPGDANSLFRIAAPGSYYLTNNLIAVSGLVTIEIVSNDVVIDLNGFTISGVTGALTAIRSEGASLRGITIRNGVVTGFPASAIDLAFTSVDGCVIEDVHAIGNGGVGIRVGNTAVVRNCVAEGNSSEGIRVDINALITGCISINNGADGIIAGIGGSLSDCAAASNSGEGFVVFGGTVMNCVARSNTGVGFAVTSSNVSGCVALTNMDSGYRAAQGVLTGCTAVTNQRHGFEVTADCLVQGNVADSNGATFPDGAGFFVTGSDSRIEGNNATDNDIGIRVTGTGNLIVRNSCSGNPTPFDIAASNRYGAIVAIGLPGTAAVNGASAPSVLTTTDPWANFSY